jgi:hypothetical protein
MPWLAALLLWSLGAPAGAQEAPAVRAQQAAERWAAVTAAREVIAGLDGLRPEGLAGRWSREILDDPRSHQRTQASRALLERQYLEEMKGLLRRRLVRLHASLNPAGSHPSFTADWLVGYVEERLGDEVHAALRANADRQFDGLFDQARRSAVAAQLAGLELEARPSLQEADAVAVSGWGGKAETRLRNTLVARMARSATLLEESAARLEAKASELIADARRQYEDQWAALEQPVDPRFRAADDLARALAAQVEEARLERRMAEGPDYPLYEVFPSVGRRIQDLAGELELRRFGDFVRRAPEAVDPESIRSRVEQDLSRHRRFRDSLDLLVRELSPAFARELLDEYSQPLPDRSRRAGHRERLSRGLKENPELAAAFDKRVEAALDGPLREVHREIAERQVAELFPEVASGRFVVSESLLLRLHRRELGVASFDDCLEIPHLREGGDALVPDVLLEASEEMVLERTGKLLDEGRRAWQGQLQLVTAQEPSITRTLRIADRRHPPSHWETFFIGEVEAHWREVGHPELWRGSARPPENAATKYLPLFGYVKDEIRKNVRAYFEPELGKEARPAPAQKPSATPAGPREQPATETGPDEPGGGEGRAEDGTKRGGGLRWRLLGGGIEGAKPSWLTWLLLLLSILLLIVAVLRTGAWRTFLSAGAWVLATVILFASFWLLGRLVVDVADLGQATAELQEILGVPPDSVDSDEAVFKLGPISRIVLQQAQPSRGDRDGPGGGGER